MEELGGTDDAALPFGETPGEVTFCAIYVRNVTPVGLHHPCRPAAVRFAPAAGGSGDYATAE
jgi:hypothetical protein